MFAIITLAAVAGLAQAATPVQSSEDARPAGFSEQPLWVSGEDGYHTYRIPSLIVTTRGTVLAFCEGRRHSRSDTGDIDLLVRRSTDGGRTWSSVQVVADHGPNTIGNPCPVVDRRTGTILLLLTGNPGDDVEHAIREGDSKGTRRVWLSRSTDDGVTWTEPVDITHSTKRPDWRWYATGPGLGIQLDCGRLVIPCDHSTADRKWGSHVIYSDDGGETWEIGGVVWPCANECQVVQTSDGSLLLNMRNCRRPGETGPHFRQIARSTDRGETWSDPEPDPQLIEPICQAALITVDVSGDSAAGAEAQKPRPFLVFSNPASQRRERLTIRLSEDDGRTWSRSRLLYEGPAAYSALAALPDGTLLCLYERGREHSYEELSLARFSLSWLTDAPATAPGD